MSLVRFHVVCGGGTGSQLLRRLHAKGYELSAGVLAENDDDALTASALGATVVLAPIPGSIEPKILARVRRCMLRSAGVILTPFAVGRGNLPNLEVVLGLPPELPVLIVVGGEFARRDYTGGEATRIYEALRARALASVASSEDLVREVTARFPLGPDFRSGN